jgi:transposase-like protein
MATATRSFGSADELRCPQCGGTMSLTRRTPHSEHGDSYERQTFTCRECRHEIERSTDTHGKPHK